MPKFNVYGIWTASKFLGEFEANTMEEAVEMAEASEENHVSLCHYCANDLDLDDWCAGRFEAVVAD
jgi:hypothetical protein